MHPYYGDTPYSRRPYGYNVQTKPFIEKYGWQNMSSGCWSRSQFNYRGPVPHYDWGFQNGGGTFRYLPHQTTRPANPVVSPQQRSLPVASPVVAPERRPLPASNPIVAPERRPLPVANPVVAPKRWSLPVSFCKICGVKLMGGHKSIEQHNNGKRHQGLLKLQEKSEEEKDINRQEKEQMPNSPMNLVVQPKVVKKSETNGCLLGNVSSKTTVIKHEDYLKKDPGETSKVPAEKPEREPRDNVAQGHGIKRKSRGNRGDKCMEKNKWIRGASESSKSDACALSNCVESLVEVPTGAPPQTPMSLQELSPAPAVGSSFEPQVQLVLQPELEHQVSEAIADFESQIPIDETNLQLPSSVSVEFDAPTASSTDTEVADGSSKAEEKMDALTAEIRIALSSRVNVCLKCGDQGFKETLVFCNQCQIYALHRYCLDGPVVFLEDVTWFCEDCESNVVETCSNDQSTCQPSGTTDTRNLDAIQVKMEIKACTKQVEESKQQEENIVAKTKVQSYDRQSSSHHGLSQCSNDCDREDKLKKECQVVLKDAANSCEETVTVENSQAATSDDLNFVELEGHVVAQPIIDPIWRGSFCLHKRSTGIVGGLLAHLSNLACSQVLDETRLLPKDLFVELLQRSTIWPNGFMKCAPNHDSIALYFFPEDERAEKDFDKLVDDTIHFDLALRAMLEHVELLVFPSTLLPIKYQRFQAKHYLWGVFKAK